MSFHKVLIVDDERIIREGIARSVKWQEMGFELQGICEDGIDAFEVIRSNPPDVAIVDITMPGMSGLELIEQVRNHNIPVSFIILSGYSEFEYAQKAISFGVKQYLIKPLDTQKLKKTLLDVKYELTRRSENGLIRLESVFRKLLQKKQCKDIYIINSFFKDEDIWLIVSQDNFDTEGCLKSGVKYIHTFDYMGYVISLFKVSKGKTYNKLLSDFSFLSSRGRTLAFSEPGDETSIYKQFDTCRKKIIKHQLSIKLSKDESINIPELFNIIDNISSTFLEGDRDKLKVFVDDLFNLCKRLVLDLKKIRVILIGLLELIDHGKLMKKSIEILNDSDMVSLQVKFVNLLSELFNNSNHQIDKEDHLPWLVSKTINELHLRYMDNNLTLRNFCENVVFSNPDYLGKQFNRYMNKTFHEYLNQIRIKSAKELITHNPYMAMYDIAERTGFGDNSQYFSKVFKSIEGITPSQFKNSIKRGLLV